MIIPVRCFSCGKVVSQHWDEVAKRVEKGESAAKVMDEAGLTRYCCRRTIFAHIGLMDEILKYPI
jgi:DNA-directed RNA polymerase subunit N